MDVSWGQRMAVVLMLRDFRACNVGVLSREARRVFWVRMEACRACCAVLSKAAVLSGVREPRTERTPPFFAFRESVGTAIWCSEGSSMKVGEVLRKASMPWTRLVNTARFIVVREDVERPWFCLLVRAKVRRVGRGKCERICCWSSSGRVLRLGFRVAIIGVSI